MKTIPPAVQTGIANGTIVTCVKATSAVTGQVEGFTTHDTVLTVSSQDYSPTAGLERIVMNLRSNTEVSNQEFAAAWVLNFPETELATGEWDNAEIEVFKVDWTQPTAGTIPVFKGHIGLVQWNEDGFRADIHSTMRDLARNIGVQVTGKCRHQLFSTSSPTKVGACGVSSGSYTYTGTVSSITAQRMIFVGTATGQATGFCANGIMTFTSGDNNGVSREVKVHTAGGTDTFEMFTPFPFPFTVGDAFSVTAGCDKTYATCKSKFSNGAAFGGFPHIRAEVNQK